MAALIGAQRYTDISSVWRKTGEKKSSGRVFALHPSSGVLFHSPPPAASLRAVATTVAATAAAAMHFCAAVLAREARVINAHLHI